MKPDSLMGNRILFSVFTKTALHVGVVTGLINMLQKKGYKVDILSIQNTANYKIKSNIDFIKSYTGVKYDVIIAFNLKGLNQVKNLRKDYNIPLIYSFCISDIDKEYLFETTQFDKILLINDDRNYHPSLFRNDFSTNLIVPFELINKDFIKSHEKSNIIVCTDNDTLLKVLPVLNNHGEYHFTVINNDSAILKKLINNNIDIVKVKKSEINEYISNSLGVIGSGEFILKSLQLEKPSIVVGRYGFGRMVSVENIQQQFQTFFQGRPGAQYGESIPFNLLSHEIECLVNISEKSENETIQLRSFVEDQFTHSSNILENLINSTVLEIDVWKELLILSSVYYYIKYENDSYVVVDCRVMKIHSLISDTEYQTIKSFEVASSPICVFNQTKRRNKKTFIQFIEKMLTNKILVKHEE